MYVTHYSTKESQDVYIFHVMSWRPVTSEEVWILTSSSFQMSEMHGATERGNSARFRSAVCRKSIPMFFTAKETRSACLLPEWAVSQDFLPLSCVSMVLLKLPDINAALAVSAITHSDRFDLTNTYFLVAGVGGVNPKVGTLGDVILSQYVVQADLQYQVDVAQTPSGWDSGYIPLGATTPSEAPTSIYGTELASVDANLRVEACLWAERASLQDSDAVRKYCQRYESGEAKRVPKVIKADVTSTNVFFHGTALSLAFENTCRVFTKHFAGRDDVIYGITAQEDAATIEALSRCAKLQTSRIIIMRTASNFDQPPPGEPVEFPIHYGHGGFGLAIENIYRAGSEIVRGILENWETLKNQRGS